MKQVQVQNRMADLVRSFINARPEWHCPYTMASLFDYYRERSMAETLGFIRRLSGHTFDGEKKPHPDESMMYLGFYSNAFIIQMNIALDQISHLAYLFYLELGKMKAIKPNYFTQQGNLHPTSKSKGLNQKSRRFSIIIFG